MNQPNPRRYGDNGLDRSSTQSSSHTNPNRSYGDEPISRYSSTGATAGSKSPQRRRPGDVVLDELPNYQYSRSNELFRDMGVHNQPTGGPPYPSEISPFGSPSPRASNAYPRGEQGRTGRQGHDRVPRSEIFERGERVERYDHHAQHNRRGDELGPPRRLANEQQRQQHQQRLIYDEPRQIPREERRQPQERQRLDDHYVRPVNRPRQRDYDHNDDDSEPRPSSRRRNRP